MNGPESNLSNESDPNMKPWCVLDVPESVWHKKMWSFVEPMRVFIGKKYYFKRYKYHNEWWIGPNDFKFHQEWLIDPIEKEA